MNQGGFTSLLCSFEEVFKCSELVGKVGKVGNSIETKPIGSLPTFGARSCLPLTAADLTEQVGKSATN